MMKKLLFALAIAVSSACGSRDAKWDTSADVDSVPAVGLTGSVAVLDTSRNQLMMLTADSGLQLGVTRLDVGRNVTKLQASADRSKLFVLSAGVQPRTRLTDEPARLTVIDGGVTPKVEKSYELSDPLTGLAVDAYGEWAVVYDGGGVVINPNELILIDLKNLERAPIEKTIRSFGSRPKRLTFTSALKVPKGPARRFLIVETELDIALIDLANPEKPEVTVQLPKAANSSNLQPQQVVYHDGDPQIANDARLAVRFSNDSSVLILDLVEPDEGSNLDYKLSPNLADLGGIASAIDFVQTDGDGDQGTDQGLRLAALLPSARKAVLVNPNTTATSVSIQLDAAYDSFARVTDEVKERPIRSDVALLWSTQASKVAFWALGRTSGKPFRAVESLDIGVPVQSVASVPGADYGHLKLIGSSRSSFFVLDLDKRQSAPMVSNNSSSFTLDVAPDGKRAWAFIPNGTSFAAIDFTDLHPRSVAVERGVSGVFDVASRSGVGRAVVALHTTYQDVSATVLDAEKPDGAVTKYYPALSLGGL